MLRTFSLMSKKAAELKEKWGGGVGRGRHLGDVYVTWLIRACSASLVRAGALPRNLAYFR